MASKVMVVAGKLGVFDIPRICPQNRSIPRRLGCQFQTEPHYPKPGLKAMAADSFCGWNVRAVPMLPSLEVAAQRVFLQ
jgi:hypothetical protein